MKKLKIEDFVDFIFPMQNIVKVAKLKVIFNF